MRYPVKIEQDGSSYSVSFPDVPEALTCGDTYEDALAEAQGALITAFEFYFEDEKKVPLPSDINGDSVAVPASVWAKVLVLNTMIEGMITQTELANRIGTRKQEVQRIVNLSHNTKIDTLANALQAMGKRLNISIV